MMKLLSVQRVFFAVSLWRRQDYCKGKER